MQLSCAGGLALFGAMHGVAVVWGRNSYTVHTLCRWSTILDIAFHLAEKNATHVSFMETEIPRFCTSCRAVKLFLSEFKPRPCPNTQTNSGTVMAPNQEPTCRSANQNVVCH